MELNRFGQMYRYICSDMENPWTIVGMVDGHPNNDIDGTVTNGATDAATVIPTEYLAYCRLPRETGKIFNWLSTKKVPQIEDEMPPASFYEVLENSDLELHTGRDGKLKVSVSCQTLDMQLYGQNVDPHLSRLVPRRRPRPRPRSSPRSPWSILGTIIMVITFMHGAFVVFRGIWNIVHQHRFNPVLETLEMPPQSIPGYLWTQLSNNIWAAAHVLRIV